jgi:predicted membrane metal-binding protein
VFKARATLTRVIAQTLRVPEPQASLLTGLLLGDDAATCRRRLAAGIPKSVQEAFRTTGTYHIIAICG